MQNDQPNHSHRSRKPYQKPQVQMVKLVPEEAVLAMCKADVVQGGPGHPLCRPIGPCVTIGS
jgi:hypothetical protein